MNNVITITKNLSHWHAGSSYSFQQAGTGPIWLDDVQCVGSEQRLIDCLYTHSHNCSHFKDTGVRCCKFTNTFHACV